MHWAAISPPEMTCIGRMKHSAVKASRRCRNSLTSGVSVSLKYRIARVHPVNEIDVGPPLTAGRHIDEAVHATHATDDTLSCVAALLRLSLSDEAPSTSRAQGMLLGGTQSSSARTVGTNSSTLVRNVLGLSPSEMSSLLTLTMRGWWECGTVARQATVPRRVGRRPARRHFHSRGPEADSKGRDRGARDPGGSLLAAGKYTRTSG